ncbi:MAG TPA: bifunctional phosphoribosyl-AMP cyclohydrolase/phosphoribosyl-ATP diphosphatase HisIE [Gammaproteobacteria bacterium]|nr:bifunctional phosphoribosyl-AMP cyclohydrolase/phosphoribosyl-ATP diphosphatase HisIE [Gammaproteobacteria bacterium]
MNSDINIKSNMVIKDLIPAVIQDVNTHAVLMLGYMNQEAYEKTLETKRVTFFSRSKNRLWTKGETSGNKLELISIFQDCDNDTLLIKAKPLGPTCHKGTQTCFNTDGDFISALEKIIQSRDENRSQKSYTSELFNSGLSRIIQKVGEEGIEVVMAALEKDDREFCGEVADLVFHLLVLLRARKLQFADIVDVLKERHKS